MYKTKFLTLSALTLFSLSALPLPAFAAEGDGDVGSRIKKLEDEIAILKRQTEVKEEEAAKKAEKAANVEFGKKGLKISSPDNNYELSLRGNFQFDGRQFLNDDGNTGKDDLLARRLRPILEAKAGDASFRLMPDFAGSTTRVFDAHADYKLADALKFRFGKFKTPVSLERLQSPADMFFVERGHASNLAPSRDFGFQIYGDLIPGTLEYQLGVFNGNADLANTDNDDDDKKDIAGRIFAHPFKSADNIALRGLGVGVAGSIGDREGNPTTTILGDYRTPGQQAFFKYRTASSSTTAATDTTYASGEHWRLYPQGYWYSGNKGLLAEYAISNQEVARGSSKGELQNKAWQVAASYVLTGEDVNFKGGIKPDEDFNLSKGGIGAWELVARVGQTDVDDSAFPIFADITKSASKASTLGAGINWYLSESVKLWLDYEHTAFDGGAAGGKDRPDEDVILSRVQYRF